MDKGIHLVHFSWVMQIWVTSLVTTLLLQGLGLFMWDPDFILLYMF